MRRWPLVLIGPLVSLAALVFILRQLDLARLLDSLRDLQISWLVLMVPVYLCTYLMRGLRWQLMLRPAKRVRLGVATSIIFLGMLANNLLPARLGELVRAFALRSREQLPTAFGLASIVPELLHKLSHASREPACNAARYRFDELGPNPGHQNDSQRDDERGCRDQPHAGKSSVETLGKRRQ